MRLFVATTFMAALAILPASAEEEAQAPAYDVHYRLMAYNVGSAAQIPLGPRQIGQIVDTIIDNAIDIVGLTEVETGSQWHDGRDHVSEICVALAQRGYPMHVYKWASFPLKGGWMSPCILSRFRIIESGFDTIEPPAGNPWCVGHITVEVVPGTPVRACMTHFWPVGDAAKRDAAVVRLVDLPKSWPGPVTIMGDFNLTPESHLYEIIGKAGWRNSCEVVHGRPCPTVQGQAGVSGPLPLNDQIDYIFGGNQVTFIDTYVGYFSMSDHWPIVAEVSVKAGAPRQGDMLPNTVRDKSPASAARADAADAYRRHDYNEAARRYLRWEQLADDPFDAGFAAYSAACMELLAGRNSDATRRLETIVETYPDTEWSTRAFQRIAFLHKDAQRWEEAEKAFIEYLAGYYTTIDRDGIKAPTVRITAQAVVECRTARGDNVSAHEILKELARNANGNLARAAAYTLAVDFIHAGKKEEAYPYLDQADPSVEGWSTLDNRVIAETYLAAGFPERADRFYANFVDTIADPLVRRIRVARWERKRHPERFEVALPRVRSIEIDGRLEDWTTDPAVILDGEPHLYLTRPGPPPYPMSARVHLGQSESTLFVAVGVSDPSHENTFTGHDIWRGDCIQLAFDPRADATPGYNEDDLEIGVALTREGVTTVALWDQRKRDVSAIRSAVARQDGHTFYEIAIPFDLLAAGETQPDRIGFNILVNYAGGDNRLGWLDWTPGIGEEKSPMLFPTLVLRR